MWIDRQTASQTLWWSLTLPIKQVRAFPSTYSMFRGGQTMNGFGRVFKSSLGVPASTWAGHQRRRLELFVLLHPPTHENWVKHTSNIHISRLITVHNLLQLLPVYA